MLLSDVDEHRALLTEIGQRAVTDITSYASTLASESSESVAAQVREAAPATIELYGPVAGESAALFYETQRPHPGFSAAVAPPSIGQQLTSDLSWAMLPLFTPDAFDAPADAFLSRLGGVVQQHVAASDRETMTQASAADPLSQGIRRFARPGACGFCAYLSTVEAPAYDWSEWHKHCTCVNVPWWHDNPLPANPDEARWSRSADVARTELLRQQTELKPADMRWRSFFHLHPDLAVTPKNIVRLMRTDLELAH